VRLGVWLGWFLYATRSSFAAERGEKSRAVTWLDHVVELGRSYAQFRTIVTISYDSPHSAFWDRAPAFVPVEYSPVVQRRWISKS
jgi:hypothetical protein